MVEGLGVVPDNRVRILFCVEGPTDVMALKCLSAALHVSDPTLPNLATDPRVAFVVLGGSTLRHWVNEHYLKELGRPEVHIYDNDVAKYGEYITKVNQRTDGSWGVLTKKREIENYLSSDAIMEGLNISASIGDADDIPELMRTICGWKSNTAKKKLARNAFPKMTATRIAARDPDGEVRGWMRRIAAMF